MELRRIPHVSQDYHPAEKLRMKAGFSKASVRHGLKHLRLEEVVGKLEFLLELGSESAF